MLIIGIGVGVVTAVAAPSTRRGDELLSWSLSMRASNLNLLSIERRLANGPVEVLEY